MYSSRRAHTDEPNATLGYLAERKTMRRIREAQGHRVGIVPDHFSDDRAKDHPDLGYLTDIATDGGEEPS